MEEQPQQRGFFGISSMGVLVGLYITEVTGFIEDVVEQSLTLQRIMVASMVFVLLVACGLYVYWFNEAERLDAINRAENAAIVTRRKRDDQ